MRLYWAVFGSLTGVGLLGLVLVVLFPPEHFDQDGQLIGEMSPEFGIAFALTVLGLTGTLAGGVALGVLRLWRRWRNRAGGRGAALQKVRGSAD